MPFPTHLLLGMDQWEGARRGGVSEGSLFFFLQIVKNSDGHQIWDTGSSEGEARGGAMVSG